MTSQTQTSARKIAIFLLAVAAYHSVNAFTNPQLPSISFPKNVNNQQKRTNDNLGLSHQIMSAPDCSSHYHQRCPSLLQATQEEEDTSTSSATSSNKVWTLEELEDYAREEGVILTWSTLGPGFRSVARSSHNESKVLGYAEGFVRPVGNILHFDKMVMFQPMVDTCKKENPDFRGGGTILGVGLLFAYQCVLFGR